MAERGLIYILINPSFPGKLKIGRTDRSVEVRARELSAATGIPTPFEIAYQRGFDDSVAAERLVHAILMQRGYSRTPNREFFDVDVTIAIDIITEAGTRLPARSHSEAEPGLEGNEAILSTSSSLESSSELTSTPEWMTLYYEALEYYKNPKHHRSDYAKAFALFEKAAALGGHEQLYFTLGNMHYLGQGTELNEELGILYWQRAVDRGQGPCSRPLANALCARGDYSRSEEYWEYYFKITLGELDVNDMYAVGSRQVFVREYLPHVHRGVLKLVCHELVRRSWDLLLDELLSYELELASPAVYTGQWNPDFDPSLSAELPEWRTFTRADANSRDYFEYAREYLSSLVDRPSRGA